jgi:anaerobic selenocysteine-containing dehydrogenase
VQHSQGIDHLGSRSDVFDALRPQPKLELSAEDAQRLGVATGDWVVIEGGAAKASQVLVNVHLAAGYAFGALNVLGLNQPAQDGGIPVVFLKKTEAPQADPLPDEEQVLLEV